MNKYAQILELPQIFTLLKNEAYFLHTKERIDDLEAFSDFDLLNIEMARVDEALIVRQRMGRFPLYLKHDTDIAYLITKTFKGGVLNCFELAEVGNFLVNIKEIFAYVNKLASNKINCELLKKQVANLTCNKALADDIKAIVTPYGEINDTASLALRRIRKKMFDLERMIQSKLIQLMQKYANITTSANIAMRNDRFVIPVKNDYKNQVKGIIHDQSASGETVFIEPQIIVEMNNQLNHERFLEGEEINRILREISGKIAANYSELISSATTLNDLDLLFAKAGLAQKIGGVKVELNRNGCIDLINAYHPLLKVEKIVKNNITLGKNYRGLIITGPNTGGKTVLLKTVGLLALMVKYGLLLPCDEASKMAFFDAVYSDIGDEQSLAQNLSTFSGHLTNIVDIINNVSRNSLVLLDELGSGTDPLEGAALGVAIINHLLKKDCCIIATSHYSELKLYAYNNPKLLNASVEFNVKTLMPTYRLLLGVPGMSNALTIAKTLGLCPEVIKGAENYVNEKSDDLKIMLEKLVDQSHELTQKLNILKEKENKLNDLILAATKEKEDTLAMREVILDKAEKEKEKIIQNAQNKAEDLLCELHDLKTKAIKPHETAALKYKIRTLAGEEKSEKKANDKEIKAGMLVYVKGYDNYGTVSKILKNNLYEVQMGSITLNAAREDLEEDKSERSPAVKPAKTEIKIPKSVSSRLDLRGMRCEDALSALDKYLDDIYYAGIKSATIIHGFGTGAVRKMVHERLRNSPNVSSFRYGGAGEGGQGATIVEMK